MSSWWDQIARGVSRLLRSMGVARAYGESRETGAPVSKWDKGPTHEPAPPPSWRNHKE